LIPEALAFLREAACWQKKEKEEEEFKTNIFN